MVLECTVLINTAGQEHGAQVHGVNKHGSSTGVEMLQGVGGDV